MFVYSVGTLEFPVKFIPRQHISVREGAQILMLYLLLIYDRCLHWYCCILF